MEATLTIARYWLKQNMEKIAKKLTFMFLESIRADLGVTNQIITITLGGKIT